MSSNSDWQQTKKNIIYAIRNLNNGMSYIGKTKDTFNRRYKGGKWWVGTENEILRKDYQKYGKDAFAVELLYEASDAENIYAIESQLICMFRTLHPDGYNQALDFTMHPDKNVAHLFYVKAVAEKHGLFTNEELITQSELFEHINRTRSPEERVRINQKKAHAHLGKKLSPEHCAAISLGNKGKKISIECRAKLSTFRTGKRHSIETKNKLSLLNKGRTHTAETKKIIRSKVIRALGRPILQLDPATNVVIREFQAISEAANSVGKPCRHGNIRQAAVHNWIAYGYRWKFKQ